jgi:conjugal transfer pilus assembly protein TraV
MNNLKISFAILAISTFSGCASLGVGEPDFACSGRPEGVRCISSSEAYKQSDRTDKLRSVNPDTGEVIPGGLDIKKEEAQQQKMVKNDPFKVVPRPSKPYPVRTPSRVIRVWVAPWVDKTDNLHAGGYMFAEVEKRTWTLGELNMNNRARLRPLKNLNTSQ